MRIHLLLLILFFVLGIQKQQAFAQCKTPTVTLPADIGYCGPQVIAFSTTSPNHAPQYTANSGTISSYSWKVNGIVTATAAYPSINFPLPGSYEVSVTATNSCGEAATDIQIITITDLPTAPVVENVAACTGSSATLWVKDANPNLRYRWYDNNGALLVWGTSYTKTPANNTYFQIEAITPEGCVSPRTIAQLTVSSTVGNSGLIGSDQEICAGTRPQMLTGNAPQSMTFQWFQSTTGPNAGYYPISTARDKDYTPPVISQTTWYKRIAYNQGCGEESNAVKITVTPVPATPIVNNTYTCYGTRATFTVSNADPTIVYRWYSSATSTTEIGTGPSFVTPQPLTADATFYVAASTTSNTNCYNITRTAASVTVTAPISNNIISADQEICSGGTAARLSGTIPPQLAGGGGGYTYQWQKSTDGILFIDIAGANGADYLPGALTTTSWFNRKVRAISSCPESISNTIRITVSPLPASISVTNNVVCSGSPANLAVSDPEPGFTYRWFDVPSGGTILATGISYTTPVLTSNKTYYIEATTAEGCITTRRAVDVTVTPLPAQPDADNITVCAGSNAILTVKVADAALFYRWYDSSGTLLATGTSYTAAPLSASATFYVEAVTKASPGCTSAKKAITVDVIPAIANNSITGNQELCSGATPASIAGAIPTGGAGGYQYQWEQSTDGSYFQAITGATGKDYAPGALTATTWFRRKVTGAGTCPESISNAIKVTVNPVPVTPILAPVSTCSGTPAILAISSPDASLVYTWYTSPTGGTAIATGPTYTTDALTSGKTYYVEATTAVGCKSTARGAVTVNVTPLPATPVASNVAICAGATTSLTVSSADATLSYNWYNAATGGTLLASGISYTTPALIANTTFYVEAATANGCVSASRKAVLVSVTPLPATPEADNTTICEGQTTTLWVKNPQPGLIYKWYQGGSQVATGISYTTDALFYSNTYEVEAISNTTTACTSATRLTVSVTVTPVVTNNTISSDQQICSGDLPDRLEGSMPAGGGNEYAYQWERSEDGLNFAPVTGATTQHYVPGALATDTWFRRKVKGNGPCPESISAPVKITVIPLPGIPVVNSPTICAGSTATLSITSAQPTLTYRWYDIASGGSTIAIGASFTTPELSNNTTYYAEAFNASGCVSPRRAVTVQVTPLPAMPVVSDKAICAGAFTTLSVSSPVTGLTYRWYNASGILLASGTSYTTDVLNASTTFYVEAATTVSPVCVSSRKTVFVSVNPTPAAPLVDNATTCSGSTAALTIKVSDPNLVYKWYTVASGGTAIATGTSFTTGILTSGKTYYAEAVNAANCASARTIVTVDVTPLPATPVADNQSVCAGSTVTLTVENPQNGISYNWYDAATDGTLLVTGESYTISAISANTTYYVEAESAAGCVSPARQAVEITVTPLPLTPQVNNTTVCAGQSAILTVITPEAGVSYKWYNSNGLNIYTGITYATPALQSGTEYYVEAVTNNAITCISADRRTVNVTVTPAIANNIISADQTICSGSTAALLTGSAPTGGEGNYTFQWERSTDGINFNTLLGATERNLSPGTLSTTTWYRRKVSAAGTCQSAVSNIVKITITPQPPTPAAQGITICQYGQASLTISTPDNNLVYNWYNVATGGNSLGTGQSFTVYNLEATATYYVEAMNSNGCTSTRRAVTVTVTPKPGTPVATNREVCTGEATTLTITAPISSQVYRWYNASGDLLRTGNSYTTDKLIASTTYYIEAATTTSTACVSDRSSVNVIVTELPGIPEIENATVCSGSIAKLEITLPDPALIYNWYTTATGGTPIATGTTLTTTALTSDRSYFVEAVSTTGCASARATVVIDVKPLPATPMAGNVSICAGSSTEIMVENPDQELIYNWYNAATDGTLLATGYTFTTGILNANTTYYVEATTITGCASPSRKAVVVSVSPLPATPEADNAIVCEGGSVTLWVKNTAPGLLYRWYENGTQIATGTSYTTDNLYSSAVYQIEAVTSGTTTCSSTRTTVTVSVTPTITNNTISADQTICSGDTFAKLTGTLPAGGGGDYTYLWERSENGQNFTVIPDAFGRDLAPEILTATTWFRRKAKGNSSCPEHYSNLVKITVVPLPSAPVANSITVCAGTTATISIATPVAGISYRWYTVPEGGSSITTGSFYKYEATAGSTTFYVEAVNAQGCTSPRRAVVITGTTVPATPQAADKAICAGDRTTLAVTAPDPALLYRWFDGNGKLLGNSSSYTTSALSSNTLFYVEAYTNTAQACASQRKAINVLVTPIPEVPEAENVRICAGSGATLSVIQIDMSLTYKWYAAATGGTALATGPTYTSDILTSNKTYYVEAITTSGCVSARKAVAVEVMPAPAVPAASNKAICAGESVTLTVTDQDAALTYRWYDAAAGGTLLATGSGYTVSNLQLSNVYFVEAVNQTGCTSLGRRAVQVTVTPMPATPVVEGTTVCAGETVKLWVNNPDPTLTYKWYSDAAGSDLIGTGISYSSATGLYTSKVYYVEVVTATGCVSTVKKQVDVNVVAKPDIPQISGATVCTGSSADLFVTAPDPALVYKWFDENGALLNTGTTYQTEALSTNTTFTVIAYTATSPACNSNAQTVEVNVVPAIVGNTIGTEQMICSGSAMAKLSGSQPTGGGSAITYQWEYSEDGLTYKSLVGTNGQEYPSVVLTKDTWFRRKVKAAGACPESISNEVKITVTPLPTTPLADNTTTCQGSSTTIAVKNASSGIVYQWHNAATGGSLLGTGITFTTGILTATTTYYVSATNTEGCTSSTRRAVTVSISSPVANNTIATDQLICSGAIPARISGSMPGGGNGIYTYQWQSSENGITYQDIAGATAQHYAPTTAYFKTTWFRRKVTATGPCAESISQAVKIEVIPLPAKPIATAATICPGGAATLQATAATGQQLEWYDAPSGGRLLHIGTTYTTPVVYATTAYFVQAVNEKGCASSERQLVQVRVAAPQVTVSPDVTITTGKSVQLSAQGGVAYSWSPAEGLSAPNSANTFASPKTTTTYTVTVTTEGGCTTTKQVTITVLPKVITSNAITANGDGLNDYFRIENIEQYPECTVHIYTRWGEKVFESKGYKEPWDGTRNGKMLPMGAYYYVIYLNDKEVPLSGSITIIK
ncbi:gliding motility-associated C-terminal domain-containing protein [Pontibacter vulgaris]|uniref:gliding motility-associated C-terminal domain-containing protein n=1 Tax=Pontibacter vulgaris TaxID=2905679 RepID=UPI001FA6D43E|nr:gliding motility-associated C-terminal domain-containing protein [Pontibacter vulgaris]